MAKTYFIHNANGTHSLGTAFTHQIAATDPADATDTATASSGGGTNDGFYEENEDTGVTRTSTGTFTCEVEVSTSTANTTITVDWYRVNSSGTIQNGPINSTEGAQSSASTGSLSFNVTNPSLGTWVSSDRLALRYTITNNAPHGGAKGPIWDTGTALSEVHTPFTDPEGGAVPLFVYHQRHHNKAL